MPVVARSAVALVAAAAALALGVAGCGGDSNGPEKSSVGTTLTVYSSLPLQGPDAGESQAIINGEKLALSKAGGHVGDFIVKYVSLDDSTASSKGWDARQSAKNARTALQDRAAIAYLGDFDPGATAITLPTLNESGMLQISPATTLVGLTRAEGADKGEPDKYYPAGTRTFGRVIPADNVQADAQIDDQLAEGCKLTYLVHDSEAYGKSLTDLLELLAPKRGLQVTDSDGIEANDNVSDQVGQIAKTGADCVFFGAISEPVAVALFKALHAAQPSLKLFAPNALATPMFAAALGAGPESVTRLTSPSLPARLYPPAGRDFLRDYRKRFGTEAGVYGMYGYEAMQLTLLALKGAGDRANDKQAVVDAFFRIGEHPSILGSYAIDKGGDTSLTAYGVYRVASGKLAFARRIATPSG